MTGAGTATGAADAGAAGSGTAADASAATPAGVRAAAADAQATADAGSGPVVLTAHPLQRIGAFALSVLAGTDDPETMTAAQFGDATSKMADDVGATADVVDSKSDGGFWLGVSYLMWPNSAMNPTMRKNLTKQQLRERIRAWRAYPDIVIDAPCALCGRAASGFFGKVDVPLGASVEHRNTTVPGHDGLALCTGCLASFHALPYGCQIGGGKAAALHSWDDSFLRRSVSVQVDRTRRQAVAGGIGSLGPYAREVAALHRLRAYEDGLWAGVELYVFSNSNREQTLDVHALEQPLAEWLRKTMRDGKLREGFRYLRRAHATEKVPGTALLARNAFRAPGQIVRRAFGYLAGLAAESGAPPAETPPLAMLCRSFVTEVLKVDERDAARITELAGRIAGLIAAGPEPGPLKRFEHVQRDSRQLQAYLKREAVDWALHSGQDLPLVSAEQWRLLFDPDREGWFNRDLLFISVLQALAAANWRPADVPEDDAGSRSAFDDTILEAGEDQ